MLKIKFDAKQIVKRAEKRRRAVDKAHIQALNRTASGVRTDGSRKIKEQVNLKVGFIKKQMNVVKANKNRPQAKVVTSGKPIPIINVGARQTRKGVTVKVKRQGQRRTIKSAFIATMPQGHTGVFRRTGRRTASGKQQIKEIWTTTASQAMRGAEVSRSNLVSAATRYRKEFDRARRYQLGRL